MDMARFEAEKMDDEISLRSDKNNTTERLQESLHGTCHNERTLGDNLTRNSLKKRERRHVYHDIAPLKTGSRNSHFDDRNVVNGCEEGTQSRSVLIKPEIPPKPKYILRDKKTRHVYQSINLSNASETVFAPPPLPFKPPRLQRLKLAPGETPPPLPPRVLNQQAIQQRQRLDHEYFENLRKSVDEELLGLAEQHDLPVPLNFPVLNDMQPSRFEYGAHSPPLNLYNASEDRPIPARRRHSLPLQELTDHDVQIHSLSSRPTTCSNNLDSEARTIGNSSETNLANNFILLKHCGWYWGNMNWQEAEEMIAKNASNGAFLVRDSQDPRHLLAITVRSTTSTLHHIRVEYCEGKFQLYEQGGGVSQSTAQCVRHSNIQQFVNLAVKHSISGSFLYFLKPRNMGEPPVQIQLLTPTSRFAKVKSLKYICRLTIREIVVPDLIAALPVPPSIQLYLKAGPYYDAIEEQDSEL